MGSILLCREAAPVGGDTNFCDCHGLWEGLPDELKELARTLKASTEVILIMRWMVPCLSPFIP